MRTSHTNEMQQLGSTNTKMQASHCSKSIPDCTTVACTSNSFAVNLSAHIGRSKRKKDRKEKRKRKRPFTQIITRRSCILCSKSGNIKLFS